MYPKDDLRRDELIAELYAVPRIVRPLWVVKQLEVALCEASPAAGFVLSGGDEVAGEVEFAVVQEYGERVDGHIAAWGWHSPTTPRSSRWNTGYGRACKPR
ncbi:MAG TPA: hypothetical protein VGL88_09410 [Pseudonocardiaceae bacterium]